MNQQEFQDAAKRYQDELLRMYRAQNMTPPPKPPAVSPLLTPAPIAAQETEYTEDTAVSAQEHSGTLRVSVTTAKGAKPVPYATVVITQELPDGKERLISMQVSNQSGEIMNVSVPAPPPSADQRSPESYRYDISVYAAGYYRERSRNVPVFPDIVSMQRFDMIPLPLGMDDLRTADAVTFSNPMPRM